MNLEDYNQVMFPNYAPLDCLPAHGKGARLWDGKGKEYIDFAAGIAVSSLGHAHPKLIDALYQQAQKFWHVSNIMTNEPAIKLAKQLTDTTFADSVFLSNSGAEANEAALKLARRFAYDNFSKDKFEIIAFENSFHGRTFFTVSVGGQSKYSEGFGPRPQGITHLPFNDVRALKAAVSDKTCAIILEPLQGEGGVISAQKEFLQMARALCDKHNALLIFDEVQTGIMRTGSLYAYMNAGITPDILTSAKGLGGGMPIAATLTRKDIAKVFSVGVHGSTFGGNPLACAVANVVLELVTEPSMKGQVQHLSKQLNNGLTSLNNEFGVFKEIRGEGLLVGCEMALEHADKAKVLVDAMLNEGVLALVAGSNVVRLVPPLVMTEQDLHIGLCRMTKAVQTFLT